MSRRALSWLRVTNARVSSAENDTGPLWNAADPRSLKSSLFAISLNDTGLSALSFNATCRNSEYWRPVHPSTGAAKPSATDVVTNINPSL